MTKDEALKLALEALEGNCTNPVADPEQAAKEDIAIAAIKEALAQPEQEPVAWVCHGVDGKHDIDFEQHEVDAVSVGTLLYTTPPQPEPVIDKSAAVRIATSLGWEPKRKPLTDEEIQKCYETTGHCQALRPQDRFAVFALARAIEAAHGIKE